MAIRQSYAIDVMVSTVSALSSHKQPVLFQRDGEFYAFTPYCFGKVSLGLATNENNPEKHKFVKEFPEILASENIILSKTERENEAAKFKKGERAYILPLVFNVDRGGESSLESMAVVFAKIKKLPDDKKIRMIAHDFQYHSHKHGYACDGTDIWLNSARVIDKEQYLDLMRAKEEEFFRAFGETDSRLLEYAYMQSTDSPQGGKPVKIPDSVVVTPNIILTFPRPGVLNYHERDQSWNSKTDFSGEHMPVYGGVSTYNKSPFSAHLILNRRIMQAQTPEELDKLTSEVIVKISEDFVGLREAMPQIESFLSRINNAHNSHFAKSVQRGEEIAARANKEIATAANK